MTKRSKPKSTSANSPPRKLRSRADLARLQQVMAGALFRPLTPGWDMQPVWPDGRRTSEAVEEFIKPNDRLTAFERLQIYNQQYWYRLFDIFYDDFPGQRALLGERKFRALCKAYLTEHQSDSFSLRNLGKYLVDFLRQNPALTGPQQALAIEMAQFEWAQIVAFDEGARPKVSSDDLLDQPPEQLRLGLQPYLTLLPLKHALDEYLAVLKKRDADILRNEASNAKSAAPKSVRRRRLAPPKKEKVFLAVHRLDNQLYYKRLSQEEHTILRGLADGRTVAEACEQAILSSKRALDWPKEIREWFQVWSQLGWFCRRS